MKAAYKKVWVQKEDARTGLQWGTWERVKVKKKFNFKKAADRMMLAAAGLYAVIWTYWLITVVIPCFAK